MFDAFVHAFESGLPHYSDGQISESGEYLRLAS